MDVISNVQKCKINKFQLKKEHIKKIIKIDKNVLIFPLFIK
jgi:hypothetical protein